MSFEQQLEDDMAEWVRAHYVRLRDARVHAPGGPDGRAGKALEAAYKELLKAADIIDRGRNRERNKNRP